MELPIINVESLVQRDEGTDVARQIADACRDDGFFYVVGHGVDEQLQNELERLSHQFFALPLEDKLAIRMELGGRAWRGYFPVGDELTSGEPDGKEGLYFGSELATNDPRVVARRPLHGRNLFPNLAGFADVVLEYLAQMTRLGHDIMRGLALSLQLQEDYFAEHYTADPTILFRIFHYPPASHTATVPATWGVGEHTDYGLLTMLRQDARGGLEVKSRSKWMEAPPVPQSFLCNIGDMLDRMTGGLYRSTPHRVKRPSSTGRLSFPFFFDPNFDATVHPILPRQPRCERWDGTDLQELHGTYGDYLLSKVRKVFPGLGEGLAE